jgi:cell wall-associated NlpC family hydrolase
MKGCPVKRFVLPAIALSLALCFISVAPSFAETTYSVKNGDTLSKIAKKFHVSVDSLKEANGLDSIKLSKKQKLIIPSKEQEPAEKPVKSKKTVITRQMPEPSGKEAVISKEPEKDSTEIGYIYHRLQPGETLDRVAKKYGLSVKELRAINDIKRKKKLTIGQNLIVGNSIAADGEVPAKSRKIKRIDISGKIEEVKALSASEELTVKSPKERLLLFAEKMMHLPYKFGANGVLGLDCSSFVQRVYSFIDFELPRSAREQFKVGEKISRDELQSGDLIFFRTYARFPSHVGIYIGDSLFIHASSLSKQVRIDSLDKPYYLKRFIGAKRLISEEINREDLPGIKQQEEVKP